MDSKEINEVKVLLESHQPFYTKKWQSNRYYPIDKFVWNEDDQTYWIIPFKVKAMRRMGWLGDIEEMLYVLTHNAYIISKGEFMDSKIFSSEGLDLIGWKGAAE